MKIVLRDQYTAFTPFTLPIYVGGPVQGGGDWQASFLTHFMNVSIQEKWSDSFRKKMLPRIIFVVPCAWEQNHALSEYFVKNPEILDSSYADEIERSPSVWLNHNMNLVQAAGGLVLYGLFPESKENPRKDGLPYACCTRTDIATSLANMKEVFALFSLFIGKHKDFLGINTIEDSLKFQKPGEWYEENTRYFSDTKQFADWIAECINPIFLS